MLRRSVFLMHSYESRLTEKNYSIIYLINERGTILKKICLVFLIAPLLSTVAVNHANSADHSVPPGRNQAPTMLAEGSFNIWPLFDYRSSPATEYSNLSILGPLFKREHSGTITKTALRPLFFVTDSQNTQETDLLYPIASTSKSENNRDTQVLRLFQKRVSRAGSPDEKRSTMLFPFYISGESEKYGPYHSFFPVYGDIYERFWRDEYHFTLFPLYGQTVKKNTISNNYIYPFFNTVSGPGEEKGFRFWPFYGKYEKPGVYEKSFILWPFYFNEHLEQNTENPVKNFYLLPFYASSTSPQRSSTYTPWPFVGVIKDAGGNVLERDYFWPFWMTANTEKSVTERYLPFYSETRTKDSSRKWLMWPIYRHITIDSPIFTQQKSSLLYFFYRNSEETWPKAGKSRARNTLWPLYAWKRDEAGVRTLSFPAPVEPVIWNDGVERNWAPLWRIFISKWDDQGNSATSILWNLFWQEKRGEDRAWEISPLISWRNESSGVELRLLKGLFAFSNTPEGQGFSLFWIPFLKKKFADAPE